MELKIGGASRRRATWVAHSEHKDLDDLSFLEKLNVVQASEKLRGIQASDTRAFRGPTSCKSCMKLLPLCLLLRIHDELQSPTDVFTLSDHYCLRLLMALLRSIRRPLLRSLKAYLSLRAPTYAQSRRSIHVTPEGLRLLHALLDASASPLD